MASIVFRIASVFPAPAPSRWHGHVRELALYVGLFLLYLLLRGLVFDGDSTALANAERIIALETALGIFKEADLQQWALASARPAVIALNWIYIATYWPVILGVALFLYLTRPSTYLRYRRLIVFHLLLSLVVFTLFPLAPPFKTGYLADTIQMLGPAFYGGEAMSQFYNTNAAMPSLHFSWTCILAWLTVKELRGWYRYLGIGYPLLTLAAIVVTGNHFLLDAVVGLALIGVSLAGLGGVVKLKIEASKRTCSSFPRRREPRRL